MNTELAISATKRILGILETHKGKSQTPNEIEDYQIPHLRFMLYQMANYAATKDQDKFMRWLGFVQGAMWSLGMTSIEEMKNINLEMRGLAAYQQEDYAWD